MKRLVLLLPLVLLCASLASANDIVVAGLPSGLDVGVAFQPLSGCRPPVGGAVGTSLTEVVTRSLVSVNIGGRPTLRQTWKSTYEGNLVVTKPVGCADTAGVVAVRILGRREGNQSNSFREVGGLSIGNSSLVSVTTDTARVLFRFDMQATTGRFTARTQEYNAPNQEITSTATINRDQIINLTVGYKDSFGADSIAETSLEFSSMPPSVSIQGSAGSAGALVFRIKVKGNSACLTGPPGSVETCGPTNRSISLSAGGVTVSRVTKPIGSGEMALTYRLRLSPQFPTGQFNVVARGRDEAPVLSGNRFLYSVRANNVQTFRDLELLPWKKKSFVATVQ